MMRCTRCGSNIDDELNACPVCGNPVDVVEKSEIIQAEIGSKIDNFLSDRLDSVKTVKDGVEMHDGQMQVTSSVRISDTIDLNSPENDSVFRKTTVSAGKQQANPEDNINPELIGAGLVDEEPEEADYGEDGYEDEDEISGRKRLNPGIIAAIIAGVVIIIALIVLLASGILSVWMNDGRGNTQDTTAATIAAETETEAQTKAENLTDTITASVENGRDYTVPLSITVRSTKGGSIYYSLDGTDPDKYSDRYTGPLKITESDLSGEDLDGGKKEYILKAVSYDPSGRIMGRYSVRFNVRFSDLDPPEFSLASGQYSEQVSISISAGSGCDIYYTYDGSEPTAASDIYSGPIEMKRGNNVLSAIAVKNGRTSEVVQAVYDLEPEPVYTLMQASDQLSDHLVNEEGFLPESEIPEKVTIPEPVTVPEPVTAPHSLDPEYGRVDTSGADSETEPVTEPETEAPTEAETEDDHLYFSIKHSGTEQFDNDVYYEFTVDIIDSDRSFVETRYYGVNDMSGEVIHLRSEDGVDFYLQ